MADYVLPRAPTAGSSPWGPEDQRGAVNRITADKICRAVKLVSKGIIYSLGRLYEESMPLVDGREYSLVMVQSASPAGKNRIVGQEEFVASYAGHNGTHVDALGHLGIGDIFYNGFHRSEFATSKGLKKLGIENAGPVITRGVLLDVARAKGVMQLPRGYEITVADLTRTLECQRLAIEPGDAVLIHTGWGSLWNVDNEQYKKGEPGIYIAGAEYLAQAGIVVVGADNWGVEVAPGPSPELLYPAHQILITQNGIYIMENVDTSALAGDRVYEFAFLYSPLPVKGGTGSPVNPVAIV